MKSSHTQLKLLSRHLVIRTDGPEDQLDPSGLARYQGEWLTVSDKGENRAIYRLVKDGETMRAEPWLALKPELVTQLLQWPGRNDKIDLEGIAVAPDGFFLVDERMRLVIKVAGDGAGTVLPIDLAGWIKRHAFNPFSGAENAGWEGVAYDPERRRLYVVNERQFRMIFEIRMKKNKFKIARAFDLPAGTDLPRRERNETLWPDFSDACYNQGALYLLYRNACRIQKVDPKTRNLVAEVSFQKTAGHLYPDSVFGVMEGLALDAGHIYLLADNNGIALEDTKRKVPIFLVYERPAGF